MSYSKILCNIQNCDNINYIKMNQTNGIDIIDWSYFTWYMIFSIKKGITPKKIKNGTTNYFKSVLKKKIISKLKKNGIINHKKTYYNNDDKNIVIIAMDCKKNNIWRKYFYPNYKITDNTSNSLERINNTVKKVTNTDSLHKKYKFDIREIIKFIKDTIIPYLVKEYNFKVIGTEDAEADDIIGIMSNYLDNRYKNSYYYKMYNNKYNNLWYNSNFCKNNIIIDDTRFGTLNYLKRESFIRIIGGDSDYFQLLDKDKNISIYNLEKKMLYTSKNIDSEYYKIYKILYGDCSDNINKCLITESYAQSIINLYLYLKNDQKRLNIFWNNIFYNNENFRQHFLFNARLTLLDTNIRGLDITNFNIPCEIKNKIIHTYEML